MFNVNPITELIKSQIMNINQNLSQIASRLNPHSFWVGKLCRTSTDGMVIRVLGLDTAGMTYKVIDPCNNHSVERGSCHFIGFGSGAMGHDLSTLTNKEEKKYKED